MEKNNINIDRLFNKNDLSEIESDISTKKVWKILNNKLFLKNFFNFNYSRFNLYYLIGLSIILSFVLYLFLSSKSQPENSGNQSGLEKIELKEDNLIDTISSNQVKKITIVTPEQTSKNEYQNSEDSSMNTLKQKLDNYIDKPVETDIINEVKDEYDTLYEPIIEYDTINEPVIIYDTIRK